MNGGGSFARRVLPYVVVFAITVAAGALILYFTQERELKGEDFDFERKVLVGEGIQRLGLVGDSGLYSGCYGVERQGELVLLRYSEAEGAAEDGCIYLGANGEVLRRVKGLGDQLQLVFANDSLQLWTGIGRLYTTRVKGPEVVLVDSVLGVENVVKAHYLGGERLLLLRFDSIGQPRQLHFSVCKLEKTVNASGYAIAELQNVGEIEGLWKSDYTSYPELSLVYDGVFNEGDSLVTYTCLHVPWVYVFDLEGNLVREITTKDRVPVPTITRFKDYFVFERGRTFNSNMASFARADTLYVFSYRVPASPGFTVDLYGIPRGGYLGSIGLESGGEATNQDVDGVYIRREVLGVLAKGELHGYRL